MADIKPQTRSSVIQLNPAYLTSGRSSEQVSVTMWHLWLIWRFKDTTPVTGDGSEGSDSEDEIVNVDEPDEMETETVPLTQAERLAENLRTQNCKSKYKYDPISNNNHMILMTKFSTRKENKLWDELDNATIWWEEKIA